MSEPQGQWECAGCGDIVDANIDPLDCFSNPTGDVLCPACLEDLKAMYHMTPEELNEGLGEEQCEPSKK